VFSFGRKYSVVIFRRVLKLTLHIFHSEIFSGYLRASVETRPSPLSSRNIYNLIFSL
jgi:hypothetical protein